MREVSSVLSDAYDRDAFQRSVRTIPGLTKARDRAARILPHAEAFVEDVFCSLFKLNVVVRKPEDLSAASQINRRMVEGILRSDAYFELKKRTELRQADAAAASIVLVDRALAALAREYRINHESLGAAATASEDESKLENLHDELEHLESIEGVDEMMKSALEDQLEKEISDLASKVEAGQSEQQGLAANLTDEIDDAVALRLSKLPAELDEVESHMRALGIGSGRQMSAARSLELGDRLLKSKKLRLLAKLVGAFRDVAREARRKRVARVPQEVHAITTGSNLERLLPSELLGLDANRRGLHLDFLRRYVERGLFEYELHGAASRGPLVVCVDASGSMNGSKELWAKAVALTLMEIARREKRRCLAILFSSGHELFEVELLRGGPGHGRRADVDDEAVLAFAEHFFGGGTSFEEPLRRATDAVASGRYRRGDVVFITDGEADVSAALVEEIEQKKKKHKFSIRGIVVDVAASKSHTLDRFCDDVKRVTDLASESLSDLFSAV